MTPSDIVGDYGRFGSATVSVHEAARCHNPDRASVGLWAGFFMALETCCRLFIGPAYD
jgi:hypothetical protein